MCYKIKHNILPIYFIKYNIYNNNMVQENIHNIMLDCAILF